MSLKGVTTRSAGLGPVGLRPSPPPLVSKPTGKENRGHAPNQSSRDRPSVSDQLGVPVKRVLVLLLVLGITLGAVTTAEAAKKKKKKSKKVVRVASEDYVAPARFYWAPTGDNIGGVSIPAATGERFVSVEIKDDAGMAVSAAVGQDPEGDGTVTTTAFCTKTDKPLPIEPGIEVVVFVYVGPCTTPAGPALATQGTVTATFSNLP